MDIQIKAGIISAITGAAAGGLISLIIEFIKRKRDDKKERRNKQENILKNRPNFEIIDYKDYIERTGYGTKQKCDLNIFMGTPTNVLNNDGDIFAEFSKDTCNQNDWCCVIYTLKNVGQTDVTCLYPSVNDRRQVVLYDQSSADICIQRGLLQYAVPLDKKIHVGDSFKLKICYHKDCILAGPLSASLELIFEDFNNNFWAQPLFAPYNQIYDSHQISHRSYHDKIVPDSAIECFKNPALW